MSKTETHTATVTQAPPSGTGDMKFEFAVIPVSDVDRAKDFYARLGWKLDMDFVRGEDFRVIQFTPPGSPGSVIFGAGIASTKSGPVQGLYLVVTDIVAARASLIERGVAVSELFHDAGGVFHRAGTDGRVSGAAPQRRSYGTFASFNDPDGNGWLMQEVTVRLPGHGGEGDLKFGSSNELASALRRARVAHDALKNGIGLVDEDWTRWFADYMFLEQSGKPLPAL